MRKYARYKDSGISWIGDVPEHWNVVPFRSEFSLGKGLPITKDNLINDEINGVPVVSYGQIHSKENEGTVLKRNLLRFVESSWLDSNPQSLLRKNDIVFADTSEDLDGCGNCVLNTETRKIFAGYHTIIAFTNNEENGPFFAYLFQSDIWRSQIRTRVNGVKVYSVTRTHLKRCKLLLPPLSEQKAIAEYLDKKTAQINELVSAKQKQIELLKEYKQSVIANAVTGKLDEINDTRRFSTLVELSSMRRTGSRPTDERREKINWIGYIPRHWQKRKFQYLFKERSEKNHPEEPVLCATQSRGVIPQSMYENRVVVVNTGFEGLKFVKKGDFVISLRSFQGGIEYAYYQGIISAAYTILYINTKDLYSDYVRLLFKSVPFIGLLQTCVTGIREGQNINNDLLRKQIIPIPPLSEQKKIVAYIEKKVSSIDSQIASIENQIANLNEYKQSLISDVVTGKVKVC